MDVRRLGPFPVIGLVGSSPFRLELPPSIRIHPIFHVALLEPYVKNTFPGRDVPQPPPVIVDGEPEWEVASVLDSKFLRGKLYYLVDLEGFDESERSWEPAQNLRHATAVIADFHRRFPARPAPRAPRSAPRGGGTVRTLAIVPRAP